MPINKDRILFEDPHFLAVHKLSGELVVKGKGEVGKLPLLDFLKKEFPGLRPVSRLDFETSGVVLFARTKQAMEASLAALKAADKDEKKAWSKVYRTLVMGRLEKKEGDLRFPLPSRMGTGNVPAHTHYKILELFGNSTYVEALITTGRHHQIRKHFSKIGHALVLDKLYGNAKYNRVFTLEFGYRRFFLHAYALSFPHPITGEQIHVEAPLPLPFVQALKRLRELL